MCGLIAMFSEKLLERHELNALKELFIVTTTRGVDSTGIVWADMIDERKYRTLKDAGNFFDLVANDPDYVKLMKANLVLGHCRWSTMGASTKENAHPYGFKEFVGMHNGTLKDLEFDGGSLQNKKFPWKKDKTDSFLFFQKLNQTLKDGGKIDDVVKDLKWSSAYAMVLWDKMSTVNFFRNYDRTLFIGVSKENGTVVLSSEERFLKFVENKKISFDIHEVETHKLYSLNLKEVGKSKTPWTTEELTRPVYPVMTSYTNYEDYEDWWERMGSERWVWDKELGCYRDRDEKSEFAD